MANPSKQLGMLADKHDNPIITTQASNIVSLTDSTTGTASDTLDDSTADTKDDLASLAAKINAIITVLETHGLTADA